MHVMLHTTHIFCTCTFILCIASLGVSIDNQGTEILQTKDKHICQNITWILEKQDVYIKYENVTLRRGDGKTIKVNYQILQHGFVNRTSITDICCRPGFFLKKHKKECKKCERGWYGLECLQKCNCTGYKKCNRKTGVCKKCIKTSCEDDEGGDDDQSTISNKDYITTPRPQSTGNTSASSTVISATEADHGIEFKCPEFTYGLNCSEKCRCLANENCNHTNGECKRCKENPPDTKCDDETSSETPETRTGDVSTSVVVVSVFIPLLVMIIILVFLVKRYHGRYNFKKRGTTESVHKLMSESSHTMKLMNESHELTQVYTSDDILRGDSYKDVDGNRVYISMYNAMNVDIRHEDSDMERKGKDLQYISMHLQYLTKSTRQSIPNDNETVESK